MPGCCFPLPFLHAARPPAQRERGGTTTTTDGAKHGLLVRRSVARRGFIGVLCLSRGRPVARSVVRLVVPFNLVRLSSIRYLFGHRMHAPAPSMHRTNESKAGGDKSEGGSGNGEL